MQTWICRAPGEAWSKRKGGSDLKLRTATRGENPTGDDGDRHAGSESCAIVMERVTVVAKRRQRVRGPRELGPERRIVVGAETAAVVEGDRDACQGSFHPHATPIPRMVSLAPTRSAGGATPHAGEEARRALRLLRHYAQLGSARVHYEVPRIWRKALARRSQQRLTWPKMNRLLKRYPLPRPRIVHQYGS